jgi:hypothetical protein
MTLRTCTSKSIPSLNKRYAILIGSLQLTWNILAEALNYAKRVLNAKTSTSNAGENHLHLKSPEHTRYTWPVRHLSACPKHAMPAIAVKSAVMANTAANNVNTWISSAPTQRITQRDQGNTLSAEVQ